MSARKRVNLGEWARQSRAVRKRVSVGRDIFRLGMGISVRMENTVESFFSLKYVFKCHNMPFAMHVVDRKFLFNYPYWLSIKRLHFWHFTV